MSNLGFTPANKIIDLWIEGLNPSAAIGGDLISVSLDPDGPGPVANSVTDKVRVTVVDVDVDLDSDNNSVDGLLGPPDRDLAEDQMEEMFGRPGKVVPINDGDFDGDGLLDYVDGYSFGGTPPHTQGGPNASDQFVPLVVTIPAPLNLSQVLITFNYDASIPVLLTDSNGDGILDTPSAGRARIWTKDGNVARDPASAIAGGDWVDPFSAFTPTQLGFGANRTMTFYIEGIHQSPKAGVDFVQVAVTPLNAPTFSVTDRVSYVVTDFLATGTIEYSAANQRSPVRHALVHLDPTGPIAPTVEYEAYTNRYGEFAIPMDVGMPSPNWAGGTLAAR